ncbi:MAG: FG-GAP-like repeat-containing protein [Chitinophagales bacterium]
MMRLLLCLLIACFFTNILQGQVAPAYFTDISVEAGFLNTGNNQGTAIADYDNDGDEDVYVSVRGGKNKLYQNNGNEVFIEVAELAGLDFDDVTLMSVWGDLDNDGYLDLFVGNYEEPNRLYRNKGDGTFENVSLSAGIGNSNRVQAVAMGDIDRDGWLDIYVANLSEQNFMYKNNGDFTFSNVVNQSNTTDTQIAMGTIFFDYDNDSDLDLYLVHDADQACILYENDGTGKFIDVSAASGTNVAINGMGVDVADFDHNGFLDIYVTNLGPNVLLLNNGDKTFTNVAENANVDNAGMGWGTTFLDYNNDTWADIYMVNNHNFAPFPNRLYHNKGDGTFEVVSYDSPLEAKKVSFGTAAADFDDDGFLDIALANWGSVGLQLFRNEMTKGNWVKIKTTGTESNRSAIGSRIQIYHDGIMQMDEVTAGSSWASQNSLTLHFGLAEAEVIDSVMIRWANGLEEMYYDLEVNQTYHFTEAEGVMITSIEEKINLIEAFNIVPNPFQDASSIEVNLLQSSSTTSKLYDMKGQEIAVLFEGNLEAGKHTFEIGENVLKKRGVYICRLESGESSITRKLVKL